MPLALRLQTVSVEPLERHFCRTWGCFSVSRTWWWRGASVRSRSLDSCRNSSNSQAADQSVSGADETLRWLSSPRRGLFLFWLVISQCCFQRKIIIIYHRNLSDFFCLENNDSCVAIIHSGFIFADPIRLACLRPVAILLVIQTEQTKVRPNSWNMKRFGVVIQSQFQDTSILERKKYATWRV